LQIDYHSDLNEVQSDEALGSLLSAPLAQAPFDRLSWWQGLAIHCGISPLLAVARTGSGLAVLPLTGGRGHLSSLANWYTFRFRPVVTDGMALSALARDLRNCAHRITLRGVPDEDGSATRLQTAFHDAGWRVHRSICDTNHILPVCGRSYEAYLASRPGTLRSTIRRKSGKLITRVFDHFNPHAWDQYETIYARSWKPEEGSLPFLRAFAQAEGLAGRLRLALAFPAHEPDAPAVAAQFWTVEGGTAFIHKLAHREDARALSPGSVLTARLMQHVIDQDRVTLVDFGTGDDPYKRDWMEQQQDRWLLEMFVPHHPRNWRPLLGRRLRSLAASAKRR
jgi:hypothetical protein